MTRPLPEGHDALDRFFSGIDTVPAMLARRASLSPGAPAYVEQRADAAWHPHTWAEVHQSVERLATSLHRWGMQPGQRIGILARTSLDWEIAQLSVLSIGGIVVGIDPYYPDNVVEELLAQTTLTGLIVQDRNMLDRLSPTARHALHFVVLIQGDSASGAANERTLQTLRSETSDIAASGSLARGDAPAVIAFSSGSTGRPKPVLYTHAQVVHACRAILALYPELSPGTRLVCWLPLANLFQRMINLASVAKGGTSYVVPDPRKVMEVLPIAKPEVFVAVPQFCERVHAGIMDKLARRPSIARAIEAAIQLKHQTHGDHADVARASAARRLLAHWADRLLLSRVRAVFGGHLKFIVTGSAPMPPWLLHRFEAFGIPVLEAYGVSEDLVPVAANRLDVRRAGTVGKPVPDNEVRIGADGQVEVRGRGVFMPSIGENAARASVLTDDGYLATGDLGAFDADGFLTLLGRRSEAFKNAQGRWISLAEIEAALRRIPGIDHAAALRLPDDRLVGVLALPSSASASIRATMTEGDAQRLAALRGHIAQATAELPRAMHPIAFIVVRKGFSPATDELTTNMKLRRAVIAERVAEPLQKLLQSASVEGRAGEIPVAFL